ncbi:hypothetical protein LTR86_002283 [Recurvomyces mirabilis]|nr:hypothetical protein LTR86_002283 [Recurvomyces mirabilis]
MVPSYNDECLFVDFKETWSVDRDTCKGFNAPFRQHNVIEQDKARARDLKLRVSRLRSAEWREERAARGPKLPTRVDHGSEKRTKDLAIAQDELEDLQENLNRSQRWYTTPEVRVLESSLRPFLMKPGLLDDHARPTAKGEPSKSGGPLRRRNSPSQDEPSSRDGSSIGSREPIDENLRLLSEYHEASEVLGKADDFIDHLEVFPSATIESCEQLANKLLADRTRAVRQAEDDYVAARQRLVDAGILVPLRSSSRPATPETFDNIGRERADREAGSGRRPPSEPGLDDMRVDAVNRRRVNNWRVTAGRGTPAAACSNEAQSPVSMPPS